MYMSPGLIHKKAVVLLLVQGFYFFHFEVIFTEFVKTHKKLLTLSKNDDIIIYVP